MRAVYAHLNTPFSDSISVRNDHTDRSVSKEDRDSESDLSMPRKGYWTGAK
jgi:hypothetical protein